MQTITDKLCPVFEDNSQKPFRNIKSIHLDKAVTSLKWLTVIKYGT